ncbi:MULTISPECIES: hypothetical protein [Sphingobacterium]|uniref:Response regulatory domain-containing protein n=1 Tax=Sphingobacterium populi TaxID=1812824 RepID=A0ABW5UHI1_9SPHI|nr:hypothetical protein [Sphingobacterium sp. CFCC 11742]
MKILFADASSLQRYSTILVAKECIADIITYETDTLSEVNAIIQKQNIAFLFIHTNLLGNETAHRLQYIRAVNEKIKMILIFSNEQELTKSAHISSYVDGVFFLEDSFENAKNYINKILNESCDTGKTPYVPTYNTYTYVETNK